MQPRHFRHVKERRRVPQPQTATVLRAGRDPAAVEEIGEGADPLRVLIEQMTMAATRGQVSTGCRKSVVSEQSLTQPDHGGLFPLLSSETERGTRVFADEDDNHSDRE